MPRPKRSIQRRRRPGWSNGQEGVDFVRCRMCGDRRRVISARHLSKHEIDREAYISEFGLSPDELIAKDFRTIQSSRPGFQPHGKRDWITAIKKVYRSEGDVFAGRLQQRHPHLYEQGVWLFGNWDNALRAVGFVPEQARLHTSEDPESIIRQIRHMRQDNLPLYAKYVIQHRPKLHSGAVRRFGSWKMALNAAGIETPKYAVGVRIHSVIEALHDLNDNPALKVPESLKLAAVHYFGSLKNGIIAAKRKPRAASVWTKGKITAELKRLHSAKQSLMYGSVQHAYPSIVRAAENHFGGWGNALFAAGINPKPYYGVGRNEPHQILNGSIFSSPVPTL